MAERGLCTLTKASDEQPRLSIAMMGGVGGRGPRKADGDSDEQDLGIDDEDDDDEDEDGDRPAPLVASLSKRGSDASQELSTVRLPETPSARSRRPAARPGPAAPAPTSAGRPGPWAGEVAAAHVLARRRRAGTRSTRRRA